MKELRISAQFKRDLKLAEKQGRRTGSLFDLIELLRCGSPVPDLCRDHALTGNWNGCRELHIAPDWLLIYSVADDAVRLARAGTHAEIYRL